MTQVFTCLFLLLFFAVPLLGVTVGPELFDRGHFWLKARREQKALVLAELNRDPEELRREAHDAHVAHNKAEHELWEHHFKTITGRAYVSPAACPDCGGPRRRQLW